MHVDEQVEDNPDDDLATHYTMAVGGAAVFFLVLVNQRLLNLPHPPVNLHTLVASVSLDSPSGAV